MKRIQNLVVEAGERAYNDDFSTRSEKYLRLFERLELLLARDWAAIYRQKADEQAEDAGSL